MIQHSHHETPLPPQTAETTGANPHCEQCGQDLKSTSYIIGASVLAGAILISASFLYGARTVLKYAESKLASVQNSQAAGQLRNPNNPANPSPSAAQPAAPTGPVKITLKPDVLFLGSASAKVTVVEFADYQCPFCEKWFSNVWPDIKSKYVDTGKIKFIYQDFAFLGADSVTASEAAHCAQDQNKFWQYHDYLFSNQGQESSGWASADHQKQFAQTLGLNSAQFNQCLTSGKYAQEVQNETSAGKSYGVTGTPSVFINGNMIVGAQPTTNFEQAIDKALSQ